METKKTNTTMTNTIIYRGILITKSYLSPTTCRECSTVQGYRTLGHYPPTLRKAKETADRYLKHYGEGALSKQGRALVEAALVRGSAESLGLKKEKLSPGIYRFGKFRCEDWTPPAHSHDRTWVVVEDKKTKGFGTPLHQSDSLKQALAWAKTETARRNS